MKHPGFNCGHADAGPVQAYSIAGNSTEYAMLCDTCTKAINNNKDDHRVVEAEPYPAPTISRS